MTIGALKRTSTHLSSAQLGITLTTLLTGYTLEPAFSIAARPPLTASGCREAASCRSSPRSSRVTIATLLSMIIGELVPKNFALALPRADGEGRHPVPGRASRRCSGRPSRCSTAPRTRILRVDRHRAEGGALRRAHRRGARLARAPLGERGQPRPRHRDPARPHPRVLRPHGPGRHDARARASRASTAPTPRRTSSSSRARTGFSRFPVIDDDIDDIVGIVHVKQAVAVPREKRARRARSRRCSPTPCACPRR